MARRATEKERHTEVNELLLWHGAKPNVLKEIFIKGFDPRFCSAASLYGTGIYFAPDTRLPHGFACRDSCSRGFAICHGTCCDQTEGGDGVKTLILARV